MRLNSNGLFFLGRVWRTFSLPFQVLKTENLFLFFFFWLNFGLLVFEPLAVFCPQKNNAESTVSPSAFFFFFGVSYKAVENLTVLFF